MWQNENCIRLCYLLLNSPTAAYLVRKQKILRPHLTHALTLTHHGLQPQVSHTQESWITGFNGKKSHLGSPLGGTRSLTGSGPHDEHSACPSHQTLV